MAARFYIWASDPHGTGQPWINLVKQAQKEYPKSQTIFGGDYIDGNAHSLETIAFVYDQVKHHDAIALRGNHEQLMHDFVEYNNDLWFYNGAKTTIKSLFGRGFSKNVVKDKLKKSEYYNFLINLPTILVEPNFIFVHAGIPCDEQVNRHSKWNKNEVYDKYLPLMVDMNPITYFWLWSRNEYFYGKNEDYIFAHNYTGHTIVSGHTPTSLIFGKYGSGQPGILPTYNWNLGSDDDPLISKRPCPVRKIQYDGEPARYLTDDGCHGCPTHHGNVCVFDSLNSKLVEVFNDDPQDEQAYGAEDK